jgi:serine/threonine protein kinase/tetratricopeptide (TPR) repeat protein
MTSDRPLDGAGAEGQATRTAGLHERLPSDRWLPETIGRYRILRLVGEGGMGSVYEAEQDHPRRIVALKIIRPGLTSAEMLRRFEREWQALGRLQHPGIAQIYEAGTADTGAGTQPYFAMEFIVGQTLTRYAAERGLDARQRLELVARICDAVQHAHERGLIHRDLKPGNILVDASGQPRILDFGVARLTDIDAYATRQTDVGQLVGTLAYMSPEQVLADPLELDTRSDVYALGVILYELLAGRLPYTIGARLHEAVQAIREEDPARLSSVSRTYRGDIETIAAKALEKDKTRRYASAAALADDIRRYLTDQPITARSPSASYQLQKFARRHKALVGGVAAVFVVLVSGIVASTSQAVRASRAEANAVSAERQVVRERDEVIKERNRALEAQTQAQQERNQALAAKQRADTEAAISKAVTEFLQKDVLAQASAREQSRPDTPPDPELKVRTALDRAGQRIGGKFTAQPLVEASIRHTIGAAYRDLGLYPQARQHMERALNLRRSALGEEDPLTTELVGELAGLSTLEGKYPAAEALYLKTIDGLRRAHGDEHPDVLTGMANLALLYQYQGRYAQAVSLIRKVLDTQRRVLGPENRGTLTTTLLLGRAHMLGDKYAESESTFIRLLEVQRRVLGPDHPERLAVMSDLAQVYNRMGKPAESESFYVKALDGGRRVLGPEHPETLSDMGSLAVMLKNQGKFAEAEPLYLEVLAVRRRLLGEEHPDTLGSMNNLGALYVAQNRFADAEPLLAKTLEARKGVLGPEHPNTLNTMSNLGQMYLRQGKYAQAEPFYAEVLAVRKRVLGADHPETLFMMNNLAVLYSQAGKSREAEALYLELLEIQRRTAGEDHVGTLRAMDNLGAAYTKRGDFERAQELFRKAFEGRRRVLGMDHPDTLWSAGNLAGMYRQLDKPDEAEALLIATLNTQRRVLGNEHYGTVTTMERLAALYREQGKYDKAQTLLIEALAARQRALGPQNPDTIEDLMMLGLVHLNQQHYAEVESLLAELVTRDKEPTDSWMRYFAQAIFGAALSGQKRYEEAEKLLIGGYGALTERAALIPANGKSALDKTGQWIVELYNAWGKPERAAEWTAKLGARGGQ